MALRALNSQSMLGGIRPDAARHRIAGLARGPARHTRSGRRFAAASPGEAVRLAAMRRHAREYGLAPGRVPSAANLAAPKRTKPARCAPHATARAMRAWRRDGRASTMRSYRGVRAASARLGAVRAIARAMGGRRQQRGAQRLAPAVRAGGRQARAAGRRSHRTGEPASPAGPDGSGHAAGAGQPEACPPRLRRTGATAAQDGRNNGMSAGKRAARPSAGPTRTRAMVRAPLR
ncbi:hypothetical protein B7759_04658 [Burkholderia glumae]|nr:hypothetical protein KS03_5017 [Burkholderia glumae LMG 2196 = ATCC 33617]QKM56826.1 hypothetical protein CG017_04893 [Burkholderia glumae]QTP36023.1 hypothetical protein B7759_04658 [Burkholderia glumae]